MKKRSLIFLAVLSGTLALVTWSAVYLSTPGSPAETRFRIEPGAGVERITEDLADRGFVRSAFFFALALRSSGLATRLQPGEYDLAGVRDYREIIERFASGRASKPETVVRILEGWNLADIAAYLERSGLAIEKKDVYALAGVPGADYRRSPAPGQAAWQEFGFLTDRPAGAGLEGYLFPDTYRVFADAGASDVIRKMLENFEAKLTPDLQAKIAASGRPIYDIVTMASIVEREVRTDPDRAIVADIFWRRLDIGMALQADSTVNYATGKSLPSATSDDILVDSPYNTYRFPGLPLGPISNPGSAAIKAAAEPQPNEYWYFLTDGEGAVHYGKTLEEHNRNKAKYLR